MTTKSSKDASGSVLLQKVGMQIRDIFQKKSLEPLAVFRAQLPFPKNVYVLNRYANYSNGNQGA